MMPERETRTTQRRQEASKNLDQASCRGERIADQWVHALGLIGSIVGLAVLMVVALPSEDVLLTVSLLIYGLGLIAMLASSALYNVYCRPGRRELYRRVDHAVIFVMIAGTYTPFLAVRIGGAWGFGLLVYVWLAAAGGVAIKLLLPRRLEGLSVVLYLVLGWTILVALDPLFESVSGQVVLLLAVGGILYSLGVIFYLWQRLPYHRVIWHGFVVTAAACHYVAVLNGVALVDGIG